MISSNGIFVATTTTLQGWEIQQYLKPVSAHLVAGTNLFSDFFASFTDVFGGRSQTYQKQISALYNDAIDQLKTKAYELGANCILGFSIDMDEISGKGKSMFMINATGTAVIAIKVENASAPINRNGKFENISYERLANLRKRKSAIKKANDESLEMTEENWNFLMENKVHDVYPFLLKKWNLFTGYDQDTLAKYQTRMLNFISALPEEKRYELIYDTLLHENNEKILKGLRSIIKELNLVDLELVKNYLKTGTFEEQKRILITLLYDKHFYSKEDINHLSEIADLIRTKFQERGQQLTKKQLFSSKEKEAWSCECGKVNDKGANCNGCGKDIYGFTFTDFKPQDALQSVEFTINELKEEFANSESLQYLRDY